MDKKKGGFLRGIVDNFRSSVTSGVHSGSKGIDILEIDEPLKPDHFELTQVVRYGFPNKPVALAFDPVQKLVAIGTKTGHIRIIGKPGVDYDIAIPDNKPVTHLSFIVADSTLLCVTSDSTFYLYKLKGERQFKEITFKMASKDSVTFLCAPISCKWIYFGTERGNIHVFNVEQGYVSDYVINWNKAIELSRKSHPGSVIHISECPSDNSRILIGYSSGFITVWDVRAKQAEFRITHPEPITSISWHHEGKQFLVSHTDGSISTWTIKTNKPNSIVFPHAKVMIDETRPEPCKAIGKVQWKTSRQTADSFIIFNGGLPLSSSIGRSPANQAQSGTKPGDKSAEEQDPANDPSTLTIIHGKQTTVLEMEYPIVDFVVCCDQLYEVEANDPYAVIVMLSEDLVIIDLTSKDFPCYRNVHTALTIHQQLPVTSCSYMVDVPMELNTALYSCGLKCQTTNAEVKNTISSSCKRMKSGAVCANTERLFSSKEWPINGGDWSSAALSYAELIITGHADGSIKFYDASSSGLHLVLKIRTSKLFQRTRLNPQNATLRKVHSSGSTGSGSPGATSEAQKVHQATVAVAATVTSSKYQMSALNKQPPPAKSPQQSSTTTYSPVNTPSDTSKDVISKELSKNKTIDEPFKACLETPFAIEHICFSPEDKVLIVASACSHIIFFKFSKSEVQSEVQGMLVNINYENEGSKVTSETGSEAEQVAQGISGLLRSSDDSGSTGRGCQSSTPNMNSNLLYLAKKESLRRPAGFQPELIIHTPFLNEKQGPPRITSLAYLSLNYLLAYGNDNGITIVDIIQKSVVFNISTPDIYGPMDPFQRYSKSPKKFEPSQIEIDRGKSPTTDQSDYPATTISEFTREDEKTARVTIRPRISQTFDPIYFPLDEYSEYYDFRRPEVEHLENAEPRLDKQVINRKKNGKFRNWLTGYYANTDNLPKRKVFEDAIDYFIDENYLIGSELKRKMREIDELIERNVVEVGVEVTEELLIDEESNEECDKDNAETTSENQQQEVEPHKILAPFIHKKYMIEEHLVPLPWMTRKMQSYPLLPPNHGYVVRHVFGLSLDDTVCRCIWFENDCDLSYKLRHENTYLSKVMEWRQTYTSEELDLLLNHNSRLANSQVPVVQFNSKLDATNFDFEEFERRTAIKRQKMQEHIRTQPKHFKDCTNRVPELGGRVRSKSVIKDFLKTHSKKVDTFSRSSSVCSMEGTGLEPISNIVFAFTYPNKTDAAPSLSIWIGTRMGTVTAFPLTFPESQESRELCLQTINIQNSTTVFRLKGNILNLTFLDLDHNGQILISASKGHQPNRNSKGHASNFNIKTRANISGSTNLSSPSATASTSMSNVNVAAGSNLPASSTGQPSTAAAVAQVGNESTTGQAVGQSLSSVLPAYTQQLLLMVSERQARVVALPSQQMIAKCILSPSTLAIRADVVYMKTSDAHCLYVYFANGQVATYAIPSLRIIKELELEPLSDDFLIESNICFNLDGHLIQFASQSEIAKYCANSALHDNLLALKPTLAKDVEIPEPPKQGLIKAVFSFGQTPFEKDEVFANAPQPSTSSTRTASAKQFKQPTGIEGIRQAAQGTLAGELAKTRQAFAERGEAIEKLENTTEKMANEAMTFRDISGQLVNKYKDKKWYNF